MKFNTYFLSPKTAEAIYGVSSPMRVSRATVVDPHNEFGIIGASLVLGIADTGKSMLPMPLGNSIPASVWRDAGGDPDCPGCGYDIWASNPALKRSVENTLSLIGNGGSFPYKKDGTVFRNAQSLLPQMSLGYYHEYTVQMPGSINRGTVRLVTGQNGEIYFTADHYQSFTRIR